MRHVRTLTFGALVAPMDAEIAELTARRDQLAGTIQSKEDANAKATLKKYRKPVEQDKNRLESLQKKLNKALSKRDDLISGESLTHYQICQIRAEMATGGKLWSEEARASLSLPRAAHEGFAEKAVRIMRGLPPIVTQEKRDMEDGDVKKLDNGHGGLQTVQVGRCGTEAMNGFLWSIMDREKTRLDAVIQRAIISGELANALLNDAATPGWFLDRLMDFVLPTVVLSQYGDIYAAFAFGYVVIPQVDASEAWTLVSITKGKPRYALRRAYSLCKMLEESAQPELGLASSQQVPDPGAVELTGKVLSEGNPVASSEPLAHLSPRHVDGGGPLDASQNNPPGCDEVSSILPEGLEVASDVDRVRVHGEGVTGPRLVGVAELLVDVADRAAPVGDPDVVGQGELDHLTPDLGHGFAADVVTR